MDIQDERVVFDDDVEVLLDAVLVELLHGERRLSQDGEARGRGQRGRRGRGREG